MDKNRWCQVGCLLLNGDSIFHLQLNIEAYTKINHFYGTLSGYQYAEAFLLKYQQGITITPR